MWKRLAVPQFIGSVMGIFEGLTPGGGGTISAFLAYNEARRWSRHKEEFGKGSPEGVAAPETANNTVACTALIPMLSLGIPGSNSAAILLGGFLIHNLIPGPDAVRQARRTGRRSLHRPVRRQRGDDHPRLFDHDALHLAGEPAEALSDGVHLRAGAVGPLFDQPQPVPDRHRARLRRASAMPCAISACLSCPWCWASCSASWSNRITAARWCCRAATTSPSSKTRFRSACSPLRWCSSSARWCATISTLKKQERQGFVA